MNTTKAKRAMRKLAKAKGISVEEVYREIELVLQDARRHPDAANQERWNAIPCNGEYPTPEEVITYIAKQMKQ